MKHTMKQLMEMMGLTETLSTLTDNNKHLLLTEIDTLLTDSRNLTRPESSLFFAIDTPGGNDGHKFIRQLYDRGVRHFVAKRVPENMHDAKDAVIFLDPSPIGSLQRLASRLVRPEGMEMVAITGSRGKTTLKEWIFQLMEPLTEISRSPRSYNSQTGVPLSLWEIRDGSRLALIEAGVSQKGEMERLEMMIRPDTVILTNIGEAHDSGFADREEKGAEKILLARHAKDVVFCLDNKELRKAIKGAGLDCRFTVWSREGNDVEASEWLRKAGSRHFVMRKKEQGEAADALWEAVTDEGVISIPVPLENEMEVENAGNAVAFMLHCGIKAKTIEERFRDLYKIGTRLNVTEGVNGCSLIFDSYTSDVSSLLPAIHFMMRRRTPGQGTTVVMSDVQHETGGDPVLPYREIARAVKETGVERFIGIGEEMKRNGSLFPEGSTFFATTEEFLTTVHPSDFSEEAILMKGAPRFGFGRINELLESRKHETVLEVNLDAMIRNYNYFRSHLPKGTGIVAMVKASGYGAGSYEIAKTLQDSGAAYLAVAVLDEGIELRRKGLRMPIMVMNPKVANYRTMFANRLEPEIYSLEMLKDVVKEAEKNGVDKYPIHLKLDTGMHRMGFIAEELEEVAEILKRQKGVRVESVFSHLATADCLDMDDYTEMQLARFDNMTDRLATLLSIPETKETTSPEKSREGNGEKHFPFKRHILNTAGILRYGKTRKYDMARLGIGLYGANTLPEEIEKPLSVVSTLRTVIIAVREWKAGETIGYSRKGVLKKDSKIATIPIGYADGMNRHFGNGKIKVLVNGKEAPTVGNICMDACMIDVTGIDCKPGDAVEIFGNAAPLQRLADALETIPYEVLTAVSPRVKRVYFRE